MKKIRLRGVCTLLEITNKWLKELKLCPRGLAPRLVPFLVYRTFLRMSCWRCQNERMATGCLQKYLKILTRWVTSRA